MATVRDPSTTTMPSAPAVAGGSGEQVARSFERVGAIAANIFQLSMNEMKADSLREAQENAPSLITYDDKGAVMPPREVGFFEGGGAYKEALRQHSRNMYRSLALGEMASKTNELTTLYPTDPDRVRTELKAYTDEKLAAMPPELARSMTPHFNAEIARAQSATIVGRDRANRAQTEIEVNGQLNQFIIDAARDIPAAQALDKPSFDRNMERFKDRREALTQMMRVSGRTDMQIAAQWEQADTLVKARSKGRELYDFVFQNGGSADPSVVARAEEQATAFARQHGKHELLVSQALNHEITRARNNRAAYDQTGVEATARDNSNIGIDLFKLRRDVDEGRPGAVQALAAARDRLINQTLTNPNMRPQDRLARLMTIQGGSTPTIAQGYQSLIADAQTTITTPIDASDPQGPQRVAYARQTLTEIRDNPQAMSAIGASGRAVVHDAIGAASVQAGIVNDATAQSEILAGKWSPGEMNRYIEAKAQRNLIGPGRNQTSAERITELRVKGQAAWDKDQAMKSSGMSAVSVLLNPQGPVPTPGDKEAIRKAIPWAPLRPNERYDATKPGVLEHTLADAMKTGFLNDDFTKWAGDLGGDATLEQRTALVQAYTTMRDWRSGRALGSDVHKKEITDAWLKDQFGTGYTKALRLATEGIEAKIGTSPPGTTNPGRQMQAPEDKAVDELDRALTGAANDGVPTVMIGDRLTNSISRTILSASPFHSGDELANLRLFTVPQLQSILQPSIKLSGIDGTNIRPDNLVIEDQARGYLLNQARQHLRDMGLDHSARGNDANRQAVIDAFTKSAGNLGVTRLPSGKYQLEFRPLTMELNRLTGQAFTEAQGKDFAISMFSGTNRTQTWEPGTEHIRGIMGTDGEMLYKLTAYTRDGRFIHVGDLKMNDPRIKPGVEAINKQIADEMGRNDVLGVLRSIGAEQILHGFMKENLTDTLLKAASGKLAPPKWVEFVQDVRRLGGLLDDGRDEVWRSLEQPAAATAITRHGLIYYLINGAEETLLPDGRRLTRPMTVPPDASGGDPQHLIPKPPRGAVPLTSAQQARQDRLREVAERDRRAIEERE